MLGGYSIRSPMKRTIVTASAGILLSAAVAGSQLAGAAGKDKT